MSPDEPARMVMTSPPKITWIASIRDRRSFYGPEALPSKVISVQVSSATSQKLDCPACNSDSSAISRA